MKTQLTLTVTALTVLLAGTISSSAAALTTAFTYHGVLDESGIRAHGAFDFKCRLFDSASGGVPLGTADSEDVVVNNGAFTLTLDFGDVFDGNQRWLEIAVRPGVSTGPHTVFERQELTAAPNALYARIAGTADSAYSARRVNWTDIAGMPVAFADDVDNDTTYGAGPGLNLSGNSFSIPISGVNNAMLAGGIGLSKLDAASAGTGDVLKFDGVKWSVGSDLIGPTYNAGLGLSLSGNTFSLDAVPLNRVSTAGATAGNTLIFDGSTAVWGNPSLFSLPFVGNAVLDGAAFSVTSQADTPLAPSTAILGVSDELSGTGVQGASLHGVGVFGYTISGTGVRGLATGGIAVSGNSENGIGMRGWHSKDSGTAPGVMGWTSSASQDATAVQGEVLETQPGPFSAAIRGINHGTGSTGIGVVGTQAGSGWGIYGRTESGYGVYGITGSDMGAGVVAAGPSPTSTALQINHGGIRVAGAGVNSSTAAFIHEATSVNAPYPELGYTIIDNASANDNPNAIILVTQRLQRIGTGFRALADRFAVVYDNDGTLLKAAGRWAIIVRDDLHEGLILGDQFNVLIIKP